MTNLEIRCWTGFSAHTITDAKNVLEALGLVQYNGRQHGWSLRSGIQRLLPFIHSLDEPVEKQIAKFAISATTASSATNGRGNSFLEESSSSNIDRKFCDLVMSTGVNGSNGTGPTAPIDERVAHWLQQAGLGTGSRKYRELLAENLDWRVVRAHALERLAQPDEIGAGLFIRRLEDRDPPPTVKRCPECYRELSPYGFCGAYDCRWPGEDEGDGEDE